jgi:lysophospholipase L1-like esterase
MIRCITLFTVFLVSLPAFAQQYTPAIPSTGFPGLDQYRASRIAIYTDDFGELKRYREADVALAASAPSENRVIFIGDSITDYWKLADYFPSRPYAVVNRGIDGQTTPQMLVRFRPDVVDLHPAVVVILAGTNDIAGNTGPETIDQIEGDYASLADIARANGIRVVFSSVMPINAYNPTALRFFLQRSPEKILALNVWLKRYCAAHGLVYLDYFSAMVDENGFLKKDLSQDGLHPNAAGFAVMAPLAQAAITQSLSQPVTARN